MVYIHGSDLHGLQAMTIYMYRRRIKHVVQGVFAIPFTPLYLLCDFRQLQISVPLFHNSSIAGWTQYMFIFMEMNVFCMRRERDGKYALYNMFFLL
jgi:hypothetical protein